MVVEIVAYVWYILIMKGVLFRFFLFIMFIIIAVIPLMAQETEKTGTGYSWFAQGSVLFFPENNGLRSDPMPILPGFGAGFGLPIINPFRLEITLDMYFTTYGFDFTLGRAVPRAWENRSAFVWGSVLGVQAAYFWDLRSNMTLRFFGGLAADLRVVLVAPDLNDASPMEEIRKETDAVLRYFWSMGRWLLPVAGTGMDFNLNEKFRLGFDIRIWLPMYKLWTGESLPFIEGWRFGIGARVTFI